MAGPVEGIKVVELGVVGSSPGRGRNTWPTGLADVVKIEPPTGDPARTFGRMLGVGGGANPPFEMDNRLKRRIVLDLATEEPAILRSNCSPTLTLLNECQAPRVVTPWGSTTQRWLQTIRVWSTG